jgi:hypothetical protein
VWNSGFAHIICAGTALLLLLLLLDSPAAGT